MGVTLSPEIMLKEPRVYPGSIENKLENWDIYKFIFDYVHIRNDVIYKQCTKADFLYIVTSGYVKLSYYFEDGNSTLLGVVSPGDGFGELGVHNGDCHTETASAMGDVSLARIRADVFRSNMIQQADMQGFLTDLLARRYRWYLHSTCNLSLNSLASRLSQVLLFLFKSLGRSRTVNGRVCQYLPTMITQSDLGAMARGTRGNVNRLLKKWERLGWILLKDRCIVLLRKSKLEEIVGQEGW